MDLTPSMIGERAEAAVAHALVQIGKAVYVPFGSSGRCDLIAEDDDGLYRVQCKSGRLAGDVITFKTYSNTKNRPKSYRGQIDHFGVYSPGTGGVYLVPIGDVGDRGCSLRVAPTRNGQRKKVSWAEDYLIFQVHPPRLEG